MEKQSNEKSHNSSEDSSNSSFLLHRSLKGLQIFKEDLEENDDEAERLARREFHKINNTALSSNSSKITKSEASFEDSSDSLQVSHCPAAEIKHHIVQCLKLNAENKINQKNAFQLKLIDFFIYFLREHDPSINNLQMASACLDASSKIYAYRVDKVHTDLLKVIGGRGEHLNENGDNFSADNNNHPVRKKRKKNHNIISTIESLKGNFETYNPSTLINFHGDAQTSDMLMQVNLPQHTNHGIALNLYKDVVLDKIPLNTKESPRYVIHLIDNFTNNRLCPSYATFKFLNPSTINDFDEFNHIDEDFGEHHFDIDEPLDDVFENSSVRNFENESEIESKTQNEKIIDFQNTIENNPNPDANYEYSYLQQNEQFLGTESSHWKLITSKNNTSEIIETCKHSPKKKSKTIEFFFTKPVKKCNKVKSPDKSKVSKFPAIQWSGSKLTDCRVVLYDIKRLVNYFNRPIEREKSTEKNEIESNLNDFDSCDEINTSTDKENMQENIINCSENTQAFIGDNLVPIPKTIEKIFVPYSQRAKKIDMHQLKTAVKKNLQIFEDQNNNKKILKRFGNLYLGLTENLSKNNAKSLSPALAFSSLLHVAHEKNLILENQLDFSDILIKKL